MSLDFGAADAEGVFQHSVGDDRVHNGLANRGDPGCGLAVVPRGAVDGLGQAPQGQAGETNDEQPEGDFTEPVTAEDVQRPGPVGLLTGLAERDLDRDPPDDRVHHAAGGQAGPGQKAQDRAVRGPTACVPDIAALAPGCRAGHRVPPFGHRRDGPQQCKPNKIRRRQ